MVQKAVQMISVEEIYILNHRSRNQLIAEEIRQNIRTIGLKRPITVTPRNELKNGKRYNLVCGQGRLEAYIEAGEKEIPALVVNVSSEDAHIMSLVENIARRNNSSIELLQSIKYLKELGYEESQIAEKTTLSREYIRGIINLLEKGEERLVNALEKGKIPLYIALKIATEDDASVRRALTDAQETGQLSGYKLISLQKLLDRRKLYGKGLSGPPKQKSNISTEDLVAFYNSNLKSKKRLLAKAEYVKQVLMFSTAALGNLLKDIHFSNQLKAEGLSDIPQQLSDLLGGNTAT
ncbi:MAG: ParB/RepB/Spo0J family partition protein [Desulfobulbaceae bacterium]|nr:MAG: ParB/RepB/Spo0J family partition protein [Desulfobulbaceae bacterium]